jgi:hypothetical protein
MNTVPMPGNISRRFDLVVGWDCEYTTSEAVEQPDGSLVIDDRPNRLLSYQLAWARTRGDRAEGQVVHYCAGGQRPALEDLLALLPMERRVLLVAHNGLAELAHLSSRPKVQAIGKVPITFGFVKVNGGTQSVQFRDTMLLAAEGQKQLKQIAETNAVYRKIDLQARVEAEYPALAELLRAEGRKAIGAMDLVLAHAPALYEEYGLFDAWAALEYYLRFQAAAEDDEIDKPVVTAVGLSQASYLVRRPDYKEVLGAESVVQPDEWGKTRTRASLHPGRAASETLATACYKGGLNTSYYHGWREAPLVLDVDLVGAYASSMATMRQIVWDSHVHTRYLRTFVQHLEAGGYGFAHCSFNYPLSAKHLQTTMGDKQGGAGLVYFRQGTCHATGDEILAALRHGAKIELHRAVVYQTSEELPFAGFLAKSSALRLEAKAAGNKFLDLLEKLKINGLYGKTGQGLGNRKTAKVTEDDKREAIRHSSLTSPQYASYITARVRCAVADLLNCARATGVGEGLSITTDGGMFAMAEGKGFADLLEAFLTTPFGQLLLQGRRALGDQGPPLTTKAEGRLALTCRTRVNAMFAEPLASNIRTVRGGAWTGWHGKTNDPALRACEMALAFESSTKSLLQWQSRLPSPKAIYAEGHEYKKIVTSITLRLDYDHKRCLGRDGTTTTWTSQSDYAECRKLAERIHNSCGVKGCNHTAGRHLVKGPGPKKYGPCRGGTKANPCKCRRFTSLPADYQVLRKWPRAVAKESPKSAPAKTPSPRVRTARPSKAPKPPRAAAPPSAGGGRGPRKGTVTHAKPR